MKMEEQAEGVQRKSIVEESTAYILCVLSVTCHAGYSVIAKVALDKGMSCYVLVFYGYAFATLTTALLAFTFERNNDSKMTVQIFRNIFILGFLRGVIATTLYYVGLDYTSPVYASALANTVPSITFILAVLFRLEKFEISKWITQAKIWGTIVALGGATIMTFYKGISVLSIHGSKYSLSSSSVSVLTVDAKWIKGSLLLLVSYVSFSAFFILQTITVKLYPAPMTLTSLACLAGTFLSAIMAAIMDHKASSWKLTWNITLLAPLYSGIVIFGVTIYLQTLVLRTKGPVFVTAFRPLSTLIVAIMSLLILGEALHLGSVLGAVLIIIGMYAILWGKKKENGKIALEPSVATATKDIENEMPEK